MTVRRLQLFRLAIARALMQGDPTLTSATARIVATLSNSPRWSARWREPLARSYVALIERGARPSLRDIVRLVSQCEQLDDAIGRRIERGRPLPRLVHDLERRNVMLPVDATASWRVPGLDTVGALASWLELAPLDLAWYADLRGWNAGPGNTQRAAPLKHYDYRVIEKPSRGLRIIESPKPQLKALQHKILREILERAPLYFDAAHGFVKGRSIRTFAAPHVGRDMVVRVDLRDFFPSISGSRVRALFRTIGYPEPVAELLAGICTNRTPRRVFAQWSAHQWRDTVALYTRRHLPQGAPSSPAMANLCAYRLDCRLTGLADWAGATYTRYADDLAFSGNDDFARRSDRYAAQIAAIAAEEGWAVQYRKTRFMRAGVSQRLAGLVVNTRLNTPRDEYDALKALLINCIRRGAASQNRDGRSDFRAHVQGRIAFVASINAARGQKLQALFDTIAWVPI